MIWPKTKKLETTPAIEVARYALRTFNVAQSDPTSEHYLGSVVRTGANKWDKGICKAECLAGQKHRPPADNCHCGVYGTLDLPSLIRQYPSQAQNVIAVFAAEGQTIIGDRGLRTEYARIVAYCAPIEYYNEICRRQFIGATEFVNIDAMLKAYHFPAYDQPKLVRTAETLVFPEPFKEYFPDCSKASTADHAHMFNVEAGTYNQIEIEGIIATITPVTLSCAGQIEVLPSWNPSWPGLDCICPSCKRETWQP